MPPEPIYSPGMARIMLAVRCLERFDLNMAITLDNYVRKRLMKDTDWPSNFDTWNSEGCDWGWLTQSQPGATPTHLPALMAKHGFEGGKTHWGEERYEFTPSHALPQNLPSIVPPESDCMVCFDPLRLESISTILPCKHTFHKGCILLWLAQDGRCPVCRQNTKEVLDNLYDLKVRGNDASKKGQCEEAIDLYSKCLSQLDALVDIPALRIALYSNMALMYLRLKSWNEAESSALQALKVPGISPQQVAKARYRLGWANMGLGNRESAVANFAEAKVYAPDDETISGALRNARGLARSYSS